MFKSIFLELNFKKIKGKVDVCLIFQGSFDDHGKSTFTVEQEEEIEIINNDPPLLGRGSPSWKEKYIIVFFFPFV